MVRPTRTGLNPRTIVSTSGSSGIRISPGFGLREFYLAQGALNNRQEPPPMVDPTLTPCNSSFSRGGDAVPRCKEGYREFRGFSGKALQSSFNFHQKTEGP